METICRFFDISKSWFYRLLNTFLNEGLKGLMKRAGRPISHQECVEAFYRLYLGESPRI